MMIWLAIFILLLAWWIWTIDLHRVPIATFFPTTKKPGRGNAIRRHQKPPWVLTETIKLCAIFPKASCRSIANLFNARFAHRQMTISKSYVHQQRLAHRHKILRLRRELRKPPPAQAPNKIWAIDFTTVSVDLDQHTLVGVLDHGSRRGLALCKSNKTTRSMIRLLTTLTDRFGKPKAIRTDNEATFKAKKFKRWMQQNHIKHALTDPHSPWQNGRIERFFGTFKRALAKIELPTLDELLQATQQFAYYYNHIRLHQHLDGLTPDMVWRGQYQFSNKTPIPFSAWHGEFVGWVWS
jgi:putative transposase